MGQVRSRDRLAASLLIIIVVGDSLITQLEGSSPDCRLIRFAKIKKWNVGRGGGERRTYFSLCCCISNIWGVSSAVPVRLMWEIICLGCCCCCSSSVSWWWKSSSSSFMSVGGAEGLVVGSMRVVVALPSSLFLHILKSLIPPPPTKIPTMMITSIISRI